MKTDELREKYLAFFETKGHVRQESDVLVPTWDPSVLFTPAGMNQFKDHFLGKVKLEFTRATTCQKCLRTGDIENVGRTAYHHTFFEMLGNFSFGDYFKREAICWAWEFLTDKKWLSLDPKRLTVSVFYDDDEAAGIWSRDVGLSSDRVERLGEDENFWPAGAPTNGPDGVCGPCSEIFYHTDRGESVEIWNLVFTQFQRVGDPPDNLRPLPSKNIDTGMGLERTAAALQGVDTNYHIDILRPLVEAAGEVCGQKYDPASEAGRRLRRIADHVRACTFAIHENVHPGPNKEKYVIRRLLRRAVLDGHVLGVREPFLFELVPVVAQLMHRPYPELGETAERVAQVIRQEETSFFATIDEGLARIEEIFSRIGTSGGVLIDGKAAAELYTTFGVPPELVESLGAERNFTFDWKGFRAAMEQHGQRSGKGQFEVFKTGPIESLKKALHRTEFLGYQATEAQVTVKGIVAQNQLCDRVSEVGHERPLIVVLDRSPFYGEAGGQVGDTGQIEGDGFLFDVTDTQRDGELILHHGHLRRGMIREGASAQARVDATRRDAIRRAHSATHVLHHALQSILGGHARQQGSKVDDDWLRFDFSNPSPVGGQQLDEIEKLANRRVGESAPVAWRNMPLAEARKSGAMMLFGEKYPDPVRVVSMGEFSKELCGGTHMNNTGQIGTLEIVTEEGVAAGTRRIVALTGRKAEEHARRTGEAIAATAEHLQVSPLEVPDAVRSLIQKVRDQKRQLSGASVSGDEPRRSGGSASSASPSGAELKAALREAARVLNVGPFDVPQRVAALLEESQNLERQLADLAQSGQLSPDTLLEQAEAVGDAQLVVADASNANAQMMRHLIDQMRSRAGLVAALLGCALADGKVLLVAGVSKDLVKRGISAGDWVREVAPIVGGGGGGRPDMAQAGGKDATRLGEALETARTTMRTMLSTRVQ